MIERAEVPGYSEISLREGFKLHTNEGSLERSDDHYISVIIHRGDICRSQSHVIARSPLWHKATADCMWLQNTIGRVVYLMQRLYCCGIETCSF